MVCIVKTMVSPVVMYGCGSWTTAEVVDWRLKTVAEDWRIDVVVGKTLRVPWTVRRLSKSILKKIISEYSLEGLMLKLQYFGHLIWRVNSWEKTLMLGKIEGRRRRGQQRMRWLYASSTQWTWVWANSARQWRTGSLVCCSPRGCKESDITEQWNNRTPNHLHVESKIWHNEPL